MKTLDLQGNLLNFYVAMALGNFTEGPDWAPFDFWEGSILYRGKEFSPLTEILDIWPEVLRLRLTSQDAGNGYWLVTLPKKSAIRQAFGGTVETYPTFCVAEPLQGYCLAVVWSVFDSEVPDVFQSNWAGSVPLELYNVPFNTPVDYDGAVKTHQLNHAAKELTMPADSSEFQQCIQRASEVLGIKVLEVKPQTIAKRASIRLETFARSTASFCGLPQKSKRVCKSLPHKDFFSL
ncbi:hypothetical protein IIE18_10315 [Pseudomonas sp. V1]|uniref:hypothetical protein n=1 Tax=Pseudomonas arcuscaelestis TaxID=2710591 RepID=UPI00193FFDE2|nr:hypothetical protein [Pseudomonas arcuscaelestis]MBM3105533.1 hypothetical protein [Pseudomonas arcuscaelestis]